MSRNPHQCLLSLEIMPNYVINATLWLLFHIIINIFPQFGEVLIKLACVK